MSGCHLLDHGASVVRRTTGPWEHPVIHRSGFTGAARCRCSRLPSLRSTTSGGGSWEPTVGDARQPGSGVGVTHSPGVRIPSTPSPVSDAVVLCPRDRRARRAPHDWMDGCGEATQAYADAGRWRGGRRCEGRSVRVPNGAGARGRADGGSRAAGAGRAGERVGAGRPPAAGAAVRGRAMPSS